MRATRHSLVFALLSAVGALESPCLARAEAGGPATDEKVLFTFAIFGDNDGGGAALDAAFENMKRIKPSFVLGMGDHFKTRKQLRTFEASIRKAFGDTKTFYERFYITAGDGEAQAYAGRQDAPGAERPFFYRVGLFDRKTDKPLRDTIVASDAKWLDYHARLHVAGLRLHLVNLYDQDSVPMHKETVAFAGKVLKGLREKHAGEPVIVMAHDGTWWDKPFKRGNALYDADLLLGASWHRFLCLGREGGGTCTGLITPAVGTGGRSWLAALVCRDRLLVCNIDERRFVARGLLPCRAKPFGKPGSLASPTKWHKLLTAYAKTVSGDWGPKPTGPPKGKGAARATRRDAP
jgi:hypothetical protein